MKIWHFCTIAGASAGLVGMGLGIRMGIAQDFTLTPVHAHINLLGWASMMLFGLYYRGAVQPCGRLGWAQAIAAAVGVLLMCGGLWINLSAGVQTAKPLIVAGAILAIGSMTLFLLVLIRDCLRAPDPLAGQAG